MKILYVNPSRISSGLDAVIKGVPLSLMSIAAMVPEHDAKIIDFKVTKYDENKFRKELNRYDVVALTSMTPQIDSALDTANIAKEQGCTILMETHDNRILDIADRIIEMEDGRLLPLEY